MSKIAIVLYGPPGSGKGTQANLLASKLEAIHFDTGKFLESVVHDPANKKNKGIQKQREMFDAGILLDPKWVLKTVARETKEIADSGFGVIFSGSPRTMFEAEGLLPELIRLFGKDHIAVFLLQISPEVTLARNSKRLMCKFCGYGLLTQYYPSEHPVHCPVCGGGFYKRSLDNVETIPKRLKEYTERTEPVLAYMKEKGIKPIPLDGKVAPYKVYEKIVAVLKKRKLI